MPAPDDTRDPFRAITAMDDWPNPARAYERGPVECHHHVSANVVRGCCLAWLSGPEPKDYADLGWAINAALGKPWRTHHPFARVADRLVQRMRQAGLVERRAGMRGWFVTAKGTAMLAAGPAALTPHPQEPGEPGRASHNGAAGRHNGEGA